MTPRREPTLTDLPYRFAQPHEKIFTFYALTYGLFSRLI